MHRKPGTMVEGEPKFIWLKMINRHAEFTKVLKLRVKYNAVLDDIMSPKKDHQVADVNYAVNDSSYFVSRNCLTGKGAVAFWEKWIQQYNFLTRRHTRWLKTNKNSTTAVQQQTMQIIYRGTVWIIIIIAGKATDSGAWDIKDITSTMIKKVLLTFIDVVTYLLGEMFTISYYFSVKIVNYL